MARVSTFTTPTSHKSRKTAFFLCLFFGMFGFHYFYVGRFGRGLVCILTMNWFMFGWLFDLFKIARGRFTDQYGMFLIA